MAATAVSRFTFANKCLPESPSFSTRFDVRYVAKKNKTKHNTVHYLNYFSLETDLAELKPAARRGIVLAIIRRLSDPLKTKESSTRFLMYNLRLKALVLAFFGGREFSEIASRDLSSHPGYDEPHTEIEQAIICGFFTAITNFQQGKIFTARAAFDTADKAFGELRHVEWLKSSQ